MRSHAKASSAGSTQGQGASQGSFVRGVDAARGASRDADGSGAPSKRRRALVVPLAAALLALVFASSAVASKQVINYFGSVSDSGSFGGDLNNPRGVAVNGSGAGPANPGDIYVADENNNRIERFASNGDFVSAWGEDVIASVINERQRIVIKASAGTYTLSFDGSTTAQMSYQVDPASQLAALPTVGGSANVGVSGQGTPANPFVVTFKGALGGSNLPTLSADTSQLSGTVGISTIVNGTSSVPDDTGTGFETCTVATECKAGVASAGNGFLDHPQSVAVDEDTGNVYVSDRGNRRIDEYDGEGSFIRSFGFDVAESGPGNTGTEYEICNQAAGDVCKAGVGGSGVGEYGTGSPENGFGIAVSPADGNAAAGGLYLANTSNRRVETFNLDGASPASFGSSANFGSEQPRAVAADSRGIVYASDSNNVQRYDSLNANGGGVGFLAPIVQPTNEVQEVSFTGFNAGDHYRLTCPNGTPTGELTYTTGFQGHEIIPLGLEEACGAGSVSVSGDPPSSTVTFKGVLGGANQPQMTCTKLSGVGSCSVTTITEGNAGPLLPGSTSGLAVDPDSDGGGSDVDVLYVLRVPSSGSAVAQQFGSTSSPPGNAPGLAAPPTAIDDTHGASAGFSTVQGLGLNASNGRLFVSSTATFNGGFLFAHRVYALADSSSLANPTASMKPIAIKAGATATFEGTVDPKGGVVGCKFQYSTDQVSWTDVSAPDCAGLAVNGGSQNVSQAVSGLIPNTTYFVRLQLTRPYFSNFTPINSGVQSFTTDSALPVLSEVMTMALDDTSVRISAKIDPSHSPTSYVVQYGTTTSLGSTTAPVSIGDGATPVEVSPVVHGLSPATTYYFKLIATNLSGSAASQGLVVGTFTTPPSFDPCPNDRFRVGPSAYLPDCRAYEQASPTDKAGSDVFGMPYSVEASTSGDGVTFHTLANFPYQEGFRNASVFLSRFADGEWSTRGMAPPPSYGTSSSVPGWAPDLSFSVAMAQDLEAVVHGLAGQNLLLRDSSTGSWTTLAPQGVGAEFFEINGAFDDDSKVVFGSRGAIPVTSGPLPKVGGTISNVYLYDRDAGGLTLAGLLPDSACATPPCVPSKGSSVASVYDNYRRDGNTVSSGGIYFIDTQGSQLYLRRVASATTVQVATSERTDCADHNPCSGTPEPDPSGTFAPIFQGATPDGSRAFFTSEQELTDDATTATGTKDLYRFDIGSPVGQRLTDLAPGAAVIGTLGYSNDGNYAYFVGNADLDGAGPASTGDCTTSGSEGKCNLYLWHDDGSGGAVTFVARLDSAIDRIDWSGSTGEGMKASRVSADGKTLVFSSASKLTAYDNAGPECLAHIGLGGFPGPCNEFYRYDGDSGQISCLTCDPTGALPFGSPGFKNPNMQDAPGSSFSPINPQSFLSRNLSTDGKRFFFQTPDKLVSADVNGDQSCPFDREPESGAGIGAYACSDVYEWEAPGKGTCTTDSGAYSPSNGGCIYLLSNPGAIYPSYLADVSESGNTAFIFSREQLVPQDGDVQEDIYAVKVDGGLAYQHSVRPAACEGDACRGVSSQASDVPGAGSAVFEGPGNPKANTNKTHCPKGKREVHAKGKGRCVAKRGKQRKQKRHHGRAANNDRRASR